MDKVGSEVLLNPSIAEISEPSLVDRLLSDPHRRSKLLAIHGIPRGVVSRRRVLLDGLSGSPKGDIDILLWVPGRPDESIAIEVKRVKAYVDGTPVIRVNKLQEFKTGVQQANRLAQIGFWQVYLWVFVLVDSRKQNAGRITYAGPTPELSTQIKRVISTQQLHERVGLIHHEFVQPMDYEPLEIGTFGGHLVQLATAVSQPHEVTAWVDDISRQMPNQG